ncbi:MAG: polysaccharide deacetylase family protein [Bacteroidales bacterium]
MGLSQQILIRTNQHSPRLSYVMQHIFKNLLGLDPIVTTSAETYNISTLPKISYTPTPGTGGLHIIPAGLLDQHGVNSNLRPAVSYLNRLPILFPSPFADTVGFDIFSAVFYILSRYEEYGACDYDRHNRFVPQSFALDTHNLYNIPVVDEWVALLKNKIKTHYPGISFKKHTYTYLPTIDVDMPYAFRQKKLPFALAGLAKNILQADWTTLKKRYAVLLGKETDPYYTFDYLNNVLANFSVRPIYFYLCNGQTPYDPIAAFRKRAIVETIRYNVPHATAGLHNSYFTLERPELIGKELRLLQKILGHEVIRSRFHYIRFQIPFSYQHLIRAGIQEEYSMGFPSFNGFRAGTSHPFYFYDLTNETATQLKIFPFQAMDATYIYYLKCTPEQVLEDLLRIRNLVQQHEGTLIIIWHNNTFEPSPQGMQWRKIFETLLA